MYEAFYLSHIKDASASGTGQRRKITGKCPFHEDGTASFSAFAHSGVWACFGACDLKGRSPVEFLSRLKKVSLDEAAELLAVSGLRQDGVQHAPAQEDVPACEPIPASVIESAHQSLLAQSAVLSAVTDKRLWSLEAIKEFKIGYNEKDGRIWFPVPGKEGWVDVRRYDWEHKAKAKFLPYAEGYGTPRPWPHPPAPDEEILLFEGEPDCLLARSLGFNAYTSTGGAGSPVPMGVRRATICYDLDQAGIDGAAKAKQLLVSAGADVRVLTLPVSGEPPKGYDFTDMVRGMGLEAFRALLHGAWAESGADTPEVTLAQAVEDRFYGKVLKVHAVASGKVLTPYQVPKSATVFCGLGLPICKRCGVADSQGTHRFSIREDSAKLIELAEEPSPRVRAILKEHLGIPKLCTSHEIEVHEVQNLYNIRLTSEVELTGGAEKSHYIAIQAWSTKDPELNTPFVMTAKAMPDPKTQAGTLLINKLESGKTSIDDFNLTPEQRIDLSAFQPGG